MYFNFGFCHMSLETPKSQQRDHYIELMLTPVGYWIQLVNYIYFLYQFDELWVHCIE